MSEEPAGVRTRSTPASRGLSACVSPSGCISADRDTSAVAARSDYETAMNEAIKWATVVLAITGCGVAPGDPEQVTSSILGSWSGRNVITDFHPDPAYMVEEWVLNIHEEVAEDRPGYPPDFRSLDASLGIVTTYPHQADTLAVRTGGHYSHPALHLYFEIDMYRLNCEFVAVVSKDRTEIAGQKICSRYVPDDGSFGTFIFDPFVVFVLTKQDEGWTSILHR